MTALPELSRAAGGWEILAGIRVAPSILAADFSRLGCEVDAVVAAGARERGRPTIAMDRYLRLMVVKQRSGWG
jgi:hypothetical protein